MADHRALIESLKQFRQDRRRGLGASDMPGVLNLGGDWKNPLSIYADKVAGSDGGMTDPQLWGHLHEPTIAAEYERRFDVGLVKPDAFIEHPEHPFLFANLDRQVLDTGRPVEIKTSSSWQGWGPEGTDEIPLPYGVQAQFQMAITGHDEMDVAVLIAGNDFRVYTLRADAETQRSLVEVGVGFWQRVQQRRQPAIDWAHPETANAIARLNTPVKGTERVLGGLADNDLIRLIDRLREVKHERKTAGEEEEELKAKITLLMGDVARVICPDGTKVTRTLIEKRPYKVEPKPYTELRLTPPKE